jgi:hypothetical protein
MSNNFTDLAKQVISKSKEQDKLSKVFNKPEFGFSTGTFSEEQKKVFLKQLNKFKDIDTFPHVVELEDQSNIFTPNEVYIDLGVTKLSGEGTVKELEFTLHSSESNDESLLHQLLGWTRESKISDKPLKSSKEILKVHTQCVCKSPDCM